MNYPQGISTLMATQNERHLVDMSIRSMLPFCDEMIVVDNGSTDGTLDIVHELVKEFPEQIRFFNRPELPDLYHNRQFAYEQARFRWIFRCDSDFIAYNEGPSDIRVLRERVLSTKGIRPVGFVCSWVNLYRDFQHCGKEAASRPKGAGHYVPAVFSRADGMARIYRRFPGMRFSRLGRGEGIRYSRVLRHVKITQPYWFHCTIKDDLSILHRSERTNWRELGDYDTYPTLASYLEKIIPEKYGTTDYAEAAREYIERDVLPYLQPYDPEQYYSYPSIIQAALTAAQGDGS